MMQCTIGDLHYGGILEYTRPLKNRNIKDLEIYLQCEESNRLIFLMDRFEEQIILKNENYLKIQEIMKKSADDFPPGDFSFIACELSRRLISNAYLKAMELGCVSLAKGNRNNADNLIRVAEEINKLDGHSGFSMMYTMEHLDDLLNIPWRAYVHRWMVSYIQK